MTTPLPEIEVKRSGTVILAAARPNMLGVVVSDGSPRTTGSVARTDRNVLAALDGPMFSPIRGAGDGAGNAVYRTYRRGRLDYLHVDSRKGINAPSRHAERGITISVVGDQAFAHRGNRIQQGASVAIQTYPSMVWNGVNEGSRDNDTENEGRAAIGILRDGRVFVATGQSGIREMAQTLISMGVDFAGYTDGGGSMAMFVRDEPGSSTFPVSRNVEGRRVISFVTLERRNALSNGLAKVKSSVNNAARILGIDRDVTDTEATVVTVACIALGVLAIGAVTSEGING